MYDGHIDGVLDVYHSLMVLPEFSLLLMGFNFPLLSGALLLSSRFMPALAAPAPPKKLRMSWKSRSINVSIL